MSLVKQRKGFLLLISQDFVAPVCVTHMEVTVGAKLGKTFASEFPSFLQYFCAPAFWKGFFL